VVHDLATPTDAPERVAVTCPDGVGDQDEPYPADYVRASRRLAACTRLIKRHNRINFSEADVSAEVVAHDHAEAVDIDAARIDVTRLTPAQADGLACVRCGVDYLTVAVPHRPVGRSGTGSQVFACSWTCAGGAA
jgi:hypothetical protein